MKNNKDNANPIPMHANNADNGNFSILARLISNSFEYRKCSTILSVFLFSRFQSFNLQKKM